MELIFFLIAAALLGILVGRWGSDSTSSIPDEHRRG